MVSRKSTGRLGKDANTRRDKGVGAGERAGRCPFVRCCLRSGTPTTSAPVEASVCIDWGQGGGGKVVSKKQKVCISMPILLRKGINPQAYKHPVSILDQSIKIMVGAVSIKLD